MLKLYCCFDIKANSIFFGVTYFGNMNDKKNSLTMYKHKALNLQALISMKDPKTYCMSHSHISTVNFSLFDPKNIKAIAPKVK